MLTASPILQAKNGLRFGGRFYLILSKKQSDKWLYLEFNSPGITLGF